MGPCKIAKILSFWFERVQVCKKMGLIAIVIIDRFFKALPTEETLKNPLVLRKEVILDRFLHCKFVVDIPSFVSLSQWS